MKISRRSLGQGGLAFLAGLALPGWRGLARAAIGFPWALPGLSGFWMHHISTFTRVCIPPL
jgi:hypothetical protein